MWKPQPIYSDFLIHQPTIFFGNNAINGLISIPSATISIIHGSSFEENMKNSLKSIFKKKSIFFNQRSWFGEPNIQSLSRTIKELEEQKPDLIIAIGGGSVIDGAKLCRLFYEYPTYEVGKTKINQLKFATKFVAIPTTIGSGAEVSSAAVYINEEVHQKEMIVSYELQPEAIVLSPTFVDKGPYRLMVASGIDAISHILEGYVSNISNHLCEVMAETGLRILVEELAEDNCNYLNMQYAGYLGGIIQNHCIVGATHGIAHQLTRYGYSHGEAIALLLMAVVKMNSTEAIVADRYDVILKKAGLNGFDEFSDFIEKLLVKSKISERKNDLKAKLKELCRDDLFIQKIVNDRGAKGNPIEINRKYIEDLIELI